MNPLTGVLILPAPPPPAHAAFVDPGMRANLGASVPSVPADTDFGTVKADTDSLTGLVYFLPNGAQSLPDFGAMTASYKLYARTFAVGPRPFAGFAGKNQNFGIRYEGSFSVANAGTYTLYLASEHGARVSVDGQVVLDNDGVHPVTYKQNDFTWPAGNHTIRVDYFLGAGTEVALELWVKPAGANQGARIWSPEL